MSRFWGPFFVALAAAAPAVLLRVGGVALSSAPLSALLFGLALLSSGFMLSWGLESAEEKVTRGLAVAVLALVTVLPEYAIDVYFAYRAGQAPSSRYAGLAAANMMGANRLLVGAGWPLLLLLYWWRTKGRERSVSLGPSETSAVTYLAVASLYGFVIVAKGRIDALDTVLLAAIFVCYLVSASHTHKGDDDEKEPEIGPGAALEDLPPAQRWTAVGLLAALAMGLILLVAEPFAESLVASGRALGVSEFLLVQWVAPLASEAPEVILCFVFALMFRPRVGLAALISDKINQWTLLVGVLPVVFSLGARGLHAFPLDARQHEEFFLTAAQSVFATALLLGRRLTLAGAMVLLALFALQIGFAFLYQADEAAAISHLSALAWLYVGLAMAVIASHVVGRLRATKAQ